MYHPETYKPAHQQSLDDKTTIKNIRLAKKSLWIQHIREPELCKSNLNMNFEDIV